MNMRKMLSVFLAVVMLFAFTACNGTQNDVGEQNPKSDTVTDESVQEGDVTPDTYLTILNSPVKR